MVVVKLGKLTMWFRRPNSSQRLYVCFLLALVTLVAWWPVTRCGFITFDDPQYVTKNPNVLPGLTWRGVGWAFCSGEAANWHPLTWLSHMLDCQLYGLTAWGHHLTNLLLHIANAVLLFLCLEKLTRARWRSAFVAALFAVHPLHVESVAWIAERKDVLSTCFGLVSLWMYVTYAQGRACVPTVERREVEDEGIEIGNQSPVSPRVSTASTCPFVRPRASLFYASALIFFALSLMSKPMLVTLPFLFLLLDFWPLDRFGQRAQSPTLGPTRPIVALVAEKLPFLALSVLSSLATLIVQKQGGAVATFDRVPFAARLANVVVSYVEYLFKTVWPTHLAVFYPLPAEQGSLHVAGAALVLILISVCVILARRRPYLLAGWCWFLGMLIPVIGLVQVGDQSMADRYTYLPLVGLFIALAWGATELAAHWPHRHLILSVGASALVFSCAALTRHQLGFWRGSESLFQHALSLGEDNYVAYDNLGASAWQNGRVDDAIDCYQKSLAIRDRFDPHCNLGLAFEKQGKWAEASAQYRAAMRLRPTNAGARLSLANALAQGGELDEAITQYRISLRENPANLAARSKLGLILASQGKLDEAIAQFRQVLGAEPENAGTRCYLGHTLAAQNKLEAAAEQYKLVLQLQPRNSEACLGLGQVLAGLGKLDEAAARCLEALQLKPDDPEAHYLLGLVLTRQGNRQQAAAHYTEALRLNPNYAAARKQLDALSAEAPHP